MNAMAHRIHSADSCSYPYLHESCLAKQNGTNQTFMRSSPRNVESVCFCVSLCYLDFIAVNCTHCIQHGAGCACAFTPYIRCVNIFRWLLNSVHVKFCTRILVDIIVGSIIVRAPTLFIENFCIKCIYGIRKSYEIANLFVQCAFI